MFLVWVKFLICASIVMVSGKRLSRYGDAIAEKTGLSRAWVGLLLLAVITSIPELASGISAASIVKAPNLAIGIVLGSNLFNLLIIALLDILHRPGPLLSKASKGHILSAGLSSLIIAIAGAGILISHWIGDLRLGWISIFSLLLFLLYLIGMRRVFRSERGQQAEASLYKEQALRYQSLSLRKTYLNFAIAAVVIIGAAIWLAYIGDELASITGWGESFVGSLFLAIVSSLPEMAVCFAALRLGAIDMAVGDLLGSNMFNTGVIITAADLSYRQGPILASVSIGQAFSAFIAVLMTGVVVAALRFRPKRKVFRLVSWDAFVLIVLYLVGAYLFFITGSRI